MDHKSFAWRRIETVSGVDSTWRGFESRLRDNDAVTADECSFWFNVKTILLLCGTRISAQHQFAPPKNWMQANKGLFRTDLHAYNTLTLIADRLEKIA